MSILLPFLITTLVFIAIDLIWLGIIAKPLYQHFMGHLLRPSPHWPVAILFYFLFILGMLIFSIFPAISQKSVTHALLMGGLYGFFTYMTYDLTNWAVLKNWPGKIVIIDILWGSVLSLSVSGMSTWIYLRLIN